MSVQQQYRHKYQPQQRKKNYKGGMIAIYIVVLLLFGLVTIGSWNLKAKAEDYKRMEEEYQTLIDEQLEIRAELEQYENEKKSKKYIEEIARSKLGLVYPDEIIFKAIE